MNKRIFSTELAYVLGILILALGTALMTLADFGLSMVVAPAYLLHLKVSQVLPFFTFGMAEYMLQAALLVLMALVMRRFKLGYLFSFGTAVLYGLALDGALWLTAPIAAASLAWRMVYFVLGMVLGSFSISLFFHTYIAPEVYELFVKEVSNKTGMDIHRFKTGYDRVSCLISVVLSFAFFGLWHFEGVGIGTIVTALVNGKLIGLCTQQLEKHFRFQDTFPLRRYFEK